MRPIRYSKLAAVAMAVILVGGLAANAMATPNANSVVIKPRIFNDCPFSIFSFVDNYPTMVSMTDQNQFCTTAYANLHVWRFSEDDVNEAVFNNGDAFRFCADLTISGPGQAEAGLQIAPWWSKDVDGRFNFRTTDGEIACFGGRLPFFTFSSPVPNPPYSEGFGVTYVKGTPVHVEMTYMPNGLSASFPAWVEYKIVYNNVTYRTVRMFDEGNPSEPYGTWGILDDARVGGHFQYFLSQSSPDLPVTVEWANICYEMLTPIATQQATWGQIKALY